MKNRWELLCTDKIIRILIGDNADCQSEGYRLGLPYLRGLLWYSKVVTLSSDKIL